jgi:hypothetical protein
MGIMTLSALLIKLAALHSATIREVLVNQRILAMTEALKLQISTNTLYNHHRTCLFYKLTKTVLHYNQTFLL